MELESDKQIIISNILYQNKYEDVIKTMQY